MTAVPVILEKNLQRSLGRSEPGEPGARDEQKPTYPEYGSEQSVRQRENPRDRQEQVILANVRFSFLICIYKAS